MKHKLEVNLVPEPLWGQGLRQIIPRSQWEKLRQSALTEYRHRCAVCGSTQTPLNCHEVWAYDDQQSVATLTHIVPLCTMCHHCTHWGRTRSVAAEGEVDLETVRQHFLTVRKWSRAKLDQHLEDAFSLWALRSVADWTLNLGPYAHLVTR